MYSFASSSADTTRQLGRKLGALLQAGDCICLQGDLGAGKTTLVQGIAAGWGARDEVSSPTFVLVNVYRRAPGIEAVETEAEALFHLDAYRIASAAEAEELDLDAMLACGPLLLEWPERVQPILPTENLWVTLEYVDETRRQFNFHAAGARYRQLLSDLEFPD